MEKDNESYSDREALGESSDLISIHEAAINSFNAIQSCSRDERLQCLQDRRFYSICGASWEGPLQDQFENKPRFEVNKIVKVVEKIITEYRNNRISVCFMPKDGTETDELSDTAAMIYRADEQNSNAEEAIDNAFEEAVGGGFGAFKLGECYENEEDEDDERQRVTFEPIYDADSSVFFDLDAKRKDKSDAKECWVISSMTYDEYVATWGDDPATWPKLITQRQFDWLTPNVVYVAEYYKIEHKKEDVHTMKDLMGEEYTIKPSDFDSQDEYKSEMRHRKSLGHSIVKKRTLNRQRVHKYIMNGNEILEDCGYIAGKYIPIIPVFGKRFFIDNIERCVGVVRYVKDVQRLKNMQISKIAEIAALGSYRKPIFAAKQINPYKVLWAEDNVKNNPYLVADPLCNPDGSVAVPGPTGYLEPPEVPAAMAALVQMSEQDINDILGNVQDVQEVQQNVSGKAIELVQTRIDMQAYIYISNLGKAIKRAGEVWLSKMKDIAIEPNRKMKGINAQGKNQQLIINKSAFDEETGIVKTTNKFADADHDITIDIGPSSASRREATVRAVTGMLQMVQDPTSQQVLSSLALMNMEGEGIEDVRQYFRGQLLQMGVVKPTPEESKQLAAKQAEAANQPPTPEQQLELAEAQESQADAQRAIAEAKRAEAQAHLEVAKAMEIIKKMHIPEQEHILKALDIAEQHNIAHRGLDIQQQATQQQTQPAAQQPLSVATNSNQTPIANQ